MDFLPALPRVILPFSGGLEMLPRDGQATGRGAMPAP